MFTDTHTHPYYSEDADGFIQRALNANVDRMIMPNVDVSSIEPMKELAGKYPENIRMAMGLHPTEVKENGEEELSKILEELESGTEYAAVGEVGIDLYWDKTFKDLQMKVFNAQLSAAERLNLPVIIHCREGLDETLEVLSAHGNVRAVFHSFGGTRADVERILKLNDRYYFGINGIVTFKNSNLRSVIPSIPKERVLLETDSPYLAPVPYRGKRNESAYLPYIAQTTADCYNMPLEELAALTRQNSIRLFGF